MGIKNRQMKQNRNGGNRNGKPERLGIPAPAKECGDKKCPFHGSVRVAPELFTGKVIRKDVHHSATLEWFRQHYLRKYERFALVRVRLRVHNPTCIDAQAGDTVIAARTRPLSKTKHHVILKIIPAGQAGTTQRKAATP